MVHICFDGKRRCHYTSRLVCLAFYGNPPSPRHEAAHRNGVRTDNRPINLSWRAPRENCADRYTHGTAGRKLDLDAAKSVVEAYRSGEKVATIAKRFGIAQNTVSHIANGRTWPEAGGYPSLARQKRPSHINRDLLDVYIVAAGRTGSAVEIARELGCSDATVSCRRQQMEAACRAAGRDLWAAASAPAS